MLKRTPNDEAVTAIVNDLKPWQRRWRREEISFGVSEQIERLKLTVTGFFDREAVIRTREGARDIIRTIDKLKQQLSKASPELQMRLKLPPYRSESELLDELALVRDECEQAASSAITKGRKDRVKEWCARIAHLLIRKYSNREPASGSSNAPFRNITGLLYESVRPTAEQGTTPDLKRACDDVLRAARQAVQFGAKKSSDL